MIAYQSPYEQKRKARKTAHKRKALAVLLVVVLLAAGAGATFWFTRGDKKPATHKTDTAVASKKEQTPKEPAKPSLAKLQPVVDKWVAKQSASYGIVVYDPANEQVIASHNPDTKFFAASLYKLYVAYLALVDFQNYAQDPNEVLTQGFTRKQCVDKMIRESYSPCGEAMMADMGQETLRKRVAEMSINNTIFAGITTTAADSARILQYIVQNRDLNAPNTDFLKNAMRIQDAKFRGGLPKGSPKATWETKVGWNLQYNYHDIGIMTLPGGRQYVVAILSQGNGSPTPIANFSATIYAALSK